MKRSIIIGWDIEDVREQLENREKTVKLTDRECMEILGAVKARP